MMNKSPRKHLLPRVFSEIAAMKLDNPDRQETVEGGDDY